MPLIFVPTPLGNLKDITLRALETLRECELIVAEDTRVARRLLAALGLPSKPLWSYREQNAESATPAILDRARSAAVAVVTDAGMPAISDPGRDLIAAARAAGIAIEVLPGPCAFVCGAVLSAYDLARFSFEGFVPRRRAERERRFRAARAGGTTSVWYESPHRIRATLESLEQIDPAMPLFVGRELTKLHEQHIAGRPADVLAALSNPPLGEFVLVLGAQAAGAGAVPATPPTERELDAEIDRAIERGESAPAIARDLAGRGFGARRDLYARVTSRRR